MRINENTPGIVKDKYGDYTFNGDIESSEDIEIELTSTLQVSGSIKSKKSIKAIWSITAGEDIEAGEGIEAGWYTKAGWYIEAGRGITAGGGITAGMGIKAGEGIKAGRGIKAGMGIEAGGGITAGEGVKAGRYIEAGGGIKARACITAGDGITAGEGVIAGWDIEAGEDIKVENRIFAGTAPYRSEATCKKEIRCRRLVSGTVAYGTLIETEGSRKMSEWISVKDKLPEPFVSVLIHMPSEEPLPTVREGFLTPAGRFNAALFNRKLNEVTHWMPMPEPPEPPEPKKTLFDALKEAETPEEMVEKLNNSLQSLFAFGLCVWCLPGWCQECPGCSDENAQKRFAEWLKTEYEEAEPK